MSTKVHETCSACARNVWPTDAGVTVPKFSFLLKFWRYECDCGNVWANLLQRKHNDWLLDKAYKVGKGMYYDQ